MRGRNSRLAARPRGAGVSLLAVWVLEDGPAACPAAGVANYCLCLAVGVRCASQTRKGGSPALLGATACEEEGSAPSPIMR